LSGFFIIVNPLLRASQFTHELFRFFGVIPKIGVKGFFFFISNINASRINVKDTSSALQGALSDF
jgi:hypothetical protein